MIRRIETWLTGAGLLLMILAGPLLSNTPAMLVIAAGLVAFPAALGHSLDRERKAKRPDPTERTEGEKLIMAQWVKSGSDDTADLERMLDWHYRNRDDLSPAEHAFRDRVWGVPARQHFRDAHGDWTDRPGAIMVMPEGAKVMRPVYTDSDEPVTWLEERSRDQAALGAGATVLADPPTSPVAYPDDPRPKEAYISCITSDSTPPATAS